MTSRPSSLTEALGDDAQPGASIEQEKEVSMVSKSFLQYLRGHGTFEAFEMTRETWVATYVRAPQLVHIKILLQRLGLLF